MENLSNQQTTIFKQLIINIVTPVVIALALLGTINIQTTRAILKNANQTRNMLVSNSLTQVLQFQDITLAVLEENITPKIRDISDQIVNKQFKSTKNIKLANLKELREQLKLDPKLYDFYVIDTNGIVVNTTFKPDLGLNFYNFGEEHTQMIKGIFKGGKFVSEKFTIEAATRRMKKYTYQPTLDRNYIIEIGIRSSTADDIISLIKNALDDFSVKEKSILSAELFMNADDPFSLTKDKAVDPIEKNFIKERFQKKDTVLVEKRIDRKYLAYQYIFMKSETSELYKGSIIRIVSDRTNEIHDENLRLISYTFIFLVVLVIIGILIFRKTRFITDPIKKLVSKVNSIADGNLNERADVVGNNEITTLSVRFNTMIEQLEDLYTDLDNKVKERTAEVVAQKEEIETQKDEIEKQRDVLEEQKKHITDSIIYAKRLQTAILPSKEFIKKTFPESFILFRPKDIVSGDFYWFNTINNKRLFSAIDCTGHGVPGSLVSMVGNNWMNYAVNDLKQEKPVDILNTLNDGVTLTFQEKEGEDSVKDGMDLALCSVDYSTMKLEFAGAYNPAIIVHDGELIQLKGDKNPIGALSRHSSVSSYQNQVVDIHKGDMVYVFSDGYPDQFGGETGQKFLIGRFKKLLTQIAPLPVVEQHDILEKTLIDWIGTKEDQIDDILVIGVRI